MQWGHYLLGRWSFRPNTGKNRLRDGIDPWGSVRALGRRLLAPIFCGTSGWAARDRRMTMTVSLNTLVSFNGTNSFGQTGYAETFSPRSYFAVTMPANASLFLFNK